MAQNRKPTTDLLGTDFEALSFSDGLYNVLWRTKQQVLDWLALFFNFKPQATNVTITKNELNTFSVTGTGDDTLDPDDGGYIQVTGFTLESGVANNDFTYSEPDGLVVPDDGYYDIDGWMNFRHTINNSTVGIVFGFEFAADPGTIVYSPRPTALNTPNGNRLGLVSGGGNAQLSAGDKVTVWIASDTTGTITCPNANLRIKKYND